MNIKRLLLAIITAICLSTLFLALGRSLGEPQVQARLQLYQSNLILHAAELKSETITNNQKQIGQNNRELIDLSQNLIGANPYSVAETQYQEALNVTEKFIQKLEKSNVKPQTVQPQVVTEVIDSDIPRKKLKEEISENKELIKELNLKIGLLKAQQHNIDSALEKWRSLENNQTAIVLTNLWEKQPRILDNAITEINNNLEGWFRYQALKRVYTLKNDRKALLVLENKEQNLAKKAIFTLIALSTVPVLGGTIGLGLIVFLVIQRLLKKEEAVLVTNNNLRWETPWNWEIIWQVLIVGFLFVSQIFIPLLFGILGFNPTNFSIRGKALYVLITYLLMSASGILVLYLSIKSFFPLPQDWFKFKGGKSFLWGLGGYLAAIPLVFLVSIINQQLWDGQGGSNPLLFLALKAQDQVALAIFFITASIAAPIFEEIMFRGFLLPSLTRYLPVSGAILVSALIFAFAHLSLAEILPLATLGIILGFVYTKSRSLLSSILVHSLWNSGTLFSLFILGSSLD